MIENVKDCGSIHLFRDIKKEEIEKMFRCSKTVERCFEDGMYIFRQGETPQNLFLVLDGTVMISKDFASGSGRHFYGERENRARRSGGVCDVCDNADCDHPPHY